MKAQWKDTSSWSRTETNRAIPKEMTLSTGKLRIVVHRYHGCGADWFVSCHEVGVERVDLRTTAIEDAKHRAYEAVRNRVIEMLASLE